MNYDVMLTKFVHLNLFTDGGRYGDRYRRDRDYEERDRRRDESRSAREQVRDKDSFVSEKWARGF